MDMSLLAQLGPVAFVLLYIGKDVVAWLKDRKAVPDQYDKDVAELKEQVGKLVEMHDVKDEDGVYVWYIRKSLTKVLEAISENLTKQTELLKELKNEIVSPHKQHTS